MIASRRRLFAWTILAAMMPLTSRADLYSAGAAADKKDFARAFELYRELAELGHLDAQENIAVMYVTGEGVKRDNVLGYAWASIALENGGGEASKGIVAQLEPHLKAAARNRIAEVQARFGKAALQERILPTPYVPGSPTVNPCQMRAAANPNDFYPAEAKRKGISGTVIVEATIAPDGRARNPRVWYSLPANVFDEAGRRLAMHNRYKAPRVDGVAIACVTRFRILFYTHGPGDGGTGEQKQILADTRTKSDSGDPRSQLLYGLLLEMRADMNAEKEPPITWYVKAAQAGLSPAQYLVGMHALSGSGQGREKDDNKGIFWLQLAADAGQADAQTALANYLLRKQPDAGAFGKAQELLEKAAASGQRDGRFYLAALLATGPDATRRDPKRSLDLLAQVMSEVDFDPTFFEVRAAAQAMLGNFAAAHADQQTALVKAKRLGWNLNDAQARLANYTASKPWTGNLFAY